MGLGGSRTVGETRTEEADDDVDVVVAGAVVGSWASSMRLARGAGTGRAAALLPLLSLLLLLLLLFLLL